MAPLKGELGAKRSEGLSPKDPTTCESHPPNITFFLSFHQKRRFSS